MSLKYTEEHEWIDVDGDVATVGITDFAQGQLGDIVFVEVPDTGAELSWPFNADQVVAFLR